jgi:hypothetical protein
MYAQMSAEKEALNYYAIEKEKSKRTIELIEVGHARIHVETRFLGGFLIQKNGWRFFYSLVRAKKLTYE